MNLKVKKLKPNTVLPKYSKDGDAGMDIIATSATHSSFYIEYGTDLAFEIPKGYAGFIFPRSSISKTDQYLRNSVGVIDSGYRGEVKIRMSVPALGRKEYKVGERIAQLIIMQLPWVDIEEVLDLDESDRGSGAFGSTGI
jgi:dUTP pyrophosphatase